MYFIFKMYKTFNLTEFKNFMFFAYFFMEKIDINVDSLERQRINTHIFVYYFALATSFTNVLLTNSC